MKTANTTQRGAIMLEALIAILIFSLGILAVVGLQAGAIKLSSDAKYRSDASLLANQIIGQMWASDHTQTTFQTNFQTGGAAYNAWLTDVYKELPGVSGVAANKPTISVVANTSTSPASNTVTVTIYWQIPGDASLHKAVAIADII